MALSERRTGPGEERWLDPTASPDFHAQFQAFAVRRNLAFFFVYGWVPVCVGLFEYSRHVIHYPLTCLALMGLWLLAASAATWWAGEFRCPRCRRRYAALGHGQGLSLTRGLFDKVCANCKLTKFELQ